MRLRRPPRSPSTASAPSSTAPNRRNRRQRTAVCGAGANARCLGLRDLYRDEVGREGAQGLQAAGLPLRVRGAEEADAVVLVALLDLGDPADELLQARRVHEHQLAEVGHDLAHVVPPRLIVDLVEERPERPVDAQVRVAPQAHDQRSAVHGGCRLEFGVLDAGYLDRGHWRPLVLTRLSRFIYNDRPAPRVAAETDRVSRRRGRPSALRPSPKTFPSRRRRRLRLRPGACGRDGARWTLWLFATAKSPSTSRNRARSKERRRPESVAVGRRARYPRGPAPPARARSRRPPRPARWSASRA